MPRAASQSTEEKVAAKAAPRKRAAPKKATTSKTTPRKRAAPKKPPAKTAPKKATARKPRAKPKPKEEPEVFGVEESLDEELEIEHTQEVEKRVRKAPTKFAAQTVERKTKQKQYIFIAVLLVLGVGTSALVGLSDEEAGQINVSQAIKDRNERMANLVDVDGPVVAAPVPTLQPNGGLGTARPADPAANRLPVTPTDTGASSTATSTDSGGTSTSTATSTDSVNEQADSAADNEAVQPSEDDSSIAMNATTTAELAGQ